MNRRYFKCYDLTTGKLHGRYTGVTPKQAASKCASKLFRLNTNQGNNNTGFDFAIRESTRGYPKKYFYYHTIRAMLPQPTTLHIGNQTITYQYRIKIYKIPNPNPDFKPLMDKTADKATIDNIVESVMKLTNINCEKMVIEI